MTNNNKPSPESVDQAMNAVLQAERSAEEAIADCEQQAQKIIQTAHTRARHIAERANERLARAHMRTSAVVKREIRTRELQEQATRLNQALYQLDAAALAEIVESVATDLTGSMSASAGSVDQPE